MTHPGQMHQQVTEPDMRAKLANPETNRKGMKISHSFQAVTISVCSVQEIIRP